MRWWLLFILTFMIGLAQMFARRSIPFPSDIIHLEILFLIALHSAVHCRRSYVVPVFWWCGLMQDIFFGYRLGVNALLYSAAGLAVIFLRDRLTGKHYASRAGLILVGLFVVQFARPVLEIRSLGGVFTVGALPVAVLTAVYAAIVGPVVGLLVNSETLRVWKEEPADYGLSEA